MRRLTAAEKDEILTDHRNGMKGKDIAEKFSVTPQTISHILNPKKIPTLREMNDDKRIKLSEAEIAEISRLYESGRTMRSLANEFGVSLFCIKYHLFPEFAKRNNRAAHALHSANEEYQKKLKSRTAHANTRAAYRRYLAKVPETKLEFVMKEYLSIYSEDQLKAALEKIYKKVTKEKKENV